MYFSIKYLHRDYLCIYYPLFICTWLSKYLVWNIEFDELDFCRLHRQGASSSKWTKNQVRQTLFFKLNISTNSIFQTQYFKNQVQIDKGLVWPSNTHHNIIIKYHCYNQLIVEIYYLHWKTKTTSPIQVLSMHLH